MSAVVWRDVNHACNAATIWCRFQALINAEDTTKAPQVRDWSVGLFPLIPQSQGIGKMFSVRKIALILAPIAMVASSIMAHRAGRDAGRVDGVLEGKISVLTTALKSLNNDETSSWSPSQGDHEWSYEAAWEAEDLMEERIRLLMHQRHQLRRLRTGLNALVVEAEKEKELRLSASKH